MKMEKDVRLRGIGLSIILIVLFVILSGAKADNVNILTNPGFENGTTGWIAIGCDVNTATSSPPPIVAHSADTHTTESQLGVK